MADVRERLILVDGFSNPLANYARGMKESAQATTKLGGTIKGLVASYAGLSGLKMLFGLSDALIQTTARIDMMNDGLQTTAELSNMIYQSAQRSRGAYAETADLIAKLGVLAKNSFSSSAEVVAFAEQLNKHFTISGTSLVGQQAAMLQLTQAMSSGVLRGEELNSVMEQAPTITTAIADSLGVSVGKMRELASEGLITSDIVKAALFSVSEETNAKFNSMPMTWGQIWVKMKNIALMALGPALSGINWLANNISIIGPIVLGIAGAISTYLIAANAANIATKVWGAAQAVFNAIMSANPIVLIVMAISVLIGLLYAGVAAYNKFTGASVSATGIIAGAFATAGAFIANVFFGLVELVSGIIEFWYNGFADFANFFGNLFNDPVGAVINLFGGMADRILGVIEKIASAMDFVFGSKLSASVASWRSSIASMTETAANKYGNGSYNKLVEKLDVNSVLSDLGISMERFNYGDAYKSGYDWGANLSFGGIFDGDASQFQIPDYGDLLSSIDKNTGKTAKNTVKSWDEDLAMLEDVTIRRYTTKVNSTSLAPNITVNVDGGGDKSMAVDIGNTLKIMLAEQMASHTTASYGEVF